MDDMSQKKGQWLVRLNKVAKCEKCENYFEEDILDIHIENCKSVETNQTIVQEDITGTEHFKNFPRNFKYECNKCEKGYKSSGGLSLHKKSVHEGIRFKCNVCNRDFKSNANLKKHVESTHEGIKHKCQKCGKQFSVKGNLDSHVKTFHNEIVILKCLK